FLLLAVGLITVLGSATVGARPPEFPGNDAAVEHARIVEYWTPERVRNAQPREMVVDRMPGGGVVAMKPGNGNPGGGKPGGGGGDPSAVGGATWTGGGSVKATTGKVLFTMGSSNYVCSGSVVQDTSSSTSLVLTAGHCVYDDVADAFATNWMFVPDYEDQRTFTCAATRYGCWTASALVTTAAWAGGDFNHDYAFAVLPAGGNGSGQLDSVVGTQAIAFNQTHPTSVFSFGYPHASPYDGQVLTYCSGTDVADSFGGSTDFGLKCDMTGGSSGGPWFTGFNESTGTGTLTSVNSFKYRGGKFKGYMFGPYLGSYANKSYTAANTADSNLLVTP
ncbi:MAG: trypsin-like peptidase domain-containing protein, partial [Acidimicrobiia bacterium]|nr:trypsin-like peptidase domain-containing protein [Acidimicrobiia bacterium]